MPLDFPPSPALNYVYSFGGKSWKWNGAAWETYNDNLGVDFVETVNGITGDVSVVGGTDISVSPSGKTLTINYTGSSVSNSVISLSGLTGTVGITGGTDISVSISGQTLTVNYTGSSVSNVVSSFNGATGAVQGVSAAEAGTGIFVSGSTGTVTITNTGVQSFNGLTGAVQGVSSWNGQTGAVTFNNYVSSFNGNTGAVQGVSAIGATASSWKKLSVGFLNSDSTLGATGFVNILGVTWADSSTTNTTVGGLASGTSINGNTVLEILEKMLFAFQPAVVSNLSVGSFTSSTLELGQTAASSGTRTVTASATNSTNIDSTGYSIIYSHISTSTPSGSGSGTLMGATAWGSSKAGINLGTDIISTTIGSSFTFTARVSNYNAWVAYGSPNPTSLGNTSSTSQSCSWYSKMYWGYTTGSSITSRSDLVGEQSRLITTTSSNYTFSSSSSISWNPPSGDQSYLYILIHDNYWNTAPNFYDASSNFPFAFSQQTPTGTITLTNDQGYSTTYKIFRSANTFNSAKSLYTT